MTPIQGTLPHAFSPTKVQHFGVETLRSINKQSAVMYYKGEPPSSRTHEPPLDLTDL